MSKKTIVLVVVGLVMAGAGAGIGIVLSKSSVDFFKKEAKKHGT